MKKKTSLGISGQNVKDFDIFLKYLLIILENPIFFFSEEKCKHPQTFAGKLNNA